jgi:hypothetical protein
MDSVVVPGWRFEEPIKNGSHYSPPYGRLQVKVQRDFITETWNKQSFLSGKGV